MYGGIVVGTTGGGADVDVIGSAAEDEMAVVGALVTELVMVEYRTIVYPGSVGDLNAMGDTVSPLIDAVVFVVASRRTYELVELDQTTVGM